MATIIQVYNHTAQLFMSGQCPPGSAYKCELLNNTAAFNAAHTQKTQVDGAGANEVSGNGWPVGGHALTNVACAIDNTNGAKFSADSIAQAIAGGSLGPYYKYLIYNDTLANKPPLAFVTLNSPITVTDGNIATVIIGPNGLFSISVTP